MLKFIAMGARFPDLFWHATPTVGSQRRLKSWLGLAEDPPLDTLSPAMLRDLGVEADQVGGHLDRATWQLRKLF
jgi:hypothetical protein